MLNLLNNGGGGVIFYLLLHSYVHWFVATTNKA